MKVYLAGKIAKNDWRSSIVPPIRSNEWGERVTYNNGMYDRHGGELLWSQHPVPFEIDGVQHECTGPFFVSCDHGCFHDSCAHGIGAQGFGEHPPACLGSEDGIPREQVPDLCFEAIGASQLVFAWIERADCHGTLLELGYAIGLGNVLTAICFDARFNAIAGVRADLWFAKHAVDLVIAENMNDGPREALRKAVRWASGNLRK